MEVVLVEWPRLARVPVPPASRAVSPLSALEPKSKAQSAQSRVHFHACCRASGAPLRSLENGIPNSHLPGNACDALQSQCNGKAVPLDRIPNEGSLCNPSLPW